ncbi:MAG TPA: o-succinylbenzoate synthase [Actinomycetota bacterium]
MGSPRIFRIPMRLRFRGVTWREGALLRGPLGWGEFSPFPEYGPPLLARWLAAAREAATRPWPAPVRTRVPVNTTIPAVGAEQAHALAAASGCRTAKVKVGEGDDEARVEAVRDALGPEGRIRLDVNGAWDVDEAARQIRVLSRHGLEYVEQPVPTTEEMSRLRRLVDVPMAADESVRLAADPRRVVLRDAADIVVLKVQPLGGVWAALEVAEALGLPAVVSSAIETSVGIAAGLALAAALADLPFACGLGTVPFLEGDVVDDPLVPVDGALEVRRPAVSEAALEPYELNGPEAGGVVARLEAASIR